MADNEMYYCEKCRKTMRASEFYSSNNLEKYPNNGKFNICKKCLTMHVDNWNPETYLWILQEADVPYIPDEWGKLMDKYGKDRRKMTGTTILGRYLSKMKLTQYRNYRWSDNDYLEEKMKAEIEQAMKRQGYSAAEIDQAITESRTNIDLNNVREPDLTISEPEQPQDYFDMINEVAAPEVDNDLTEEDKVYLRLKWGKTYRPDEWVRLEQFYEEMMASYDIQGAGHIDNLKLLCKTSLKANQLIDMGDIEGFQKMSKVYDSLMKSGNFTANQNKTENGEFVDSISELVEICEKEGFIPRFYTDAPMDKVDETLKDLKNYTYTLVTEEMNLGNLIENAIKEMERQENVEEDEDIEEELDYDNIDELTDEDFIEYREMLEEEENELDLLLNDGFGGL